MLLLSTPPFVFELLYQEFFIIISVSGDLLFNFREGVFTRRTRVIDIIVILTSMTLSVKKLKVGNSAREIVFIQVVC